MANDVPRKPKSEWAAKVLEKRRAEAAGRVLLINHLPYGFFENELFGYFSQFGRIKRIRMPRTKAGLFKDRAYVYFGEAEVARVAADTMDNYLLFEKRLRCRVLNEKIPPTILAGPRLIRSKPRPDRHARTAAKRAIAERTDEEEEQAKKALISSLRKMLRKARAAGFDYAFDYSAKI